MSEKLPDAIQHDLCQARDLHLRATSDYKKCLEFNKTMSDLLGRLEDEGYDQMADKVMTILMECHPREGAHCDKSSSVATKIQKITHEFSED